MLSHVRRTLLTLVAALALTALAPAMASATITPTMTVSSNSTAAGATVSLSTDVKFAPSGGDTPKDMTLSLPAGLLSNAAIDGGACLKTSSPIAACQVGTGTANALAAGILPASQSLTLYLVAPPKPADLAGLLIESGGSPLGSAGDVSVRPASSPRGVGVDVAFHNIPSTSSGLSVSVTEIQTTLTGVRMPTACPSPAATTVVTADSYKDATAKSTSAPLTVTGCNTLPFTPTFALSAVRDAADAGVALTTDITQPASPAQATDRSAVLTLPTSVFTPNVSAVLSGGILCPSVSSSCKSIGSASSTSPLYPKTLTGSAYLIGSLSDLNNIQLALVFPPPFALTLTGAVNISQGTTTFTGLPDLPLTDLQVKLNGGPDAVFNATCNPASGTASSTLTTQNGDRTVTASAPFTVSGCPAGGGGTGGGGNGGGGTGGGGTGGSGGPGTPAAGPPRVIGGSVKGLAKGAPVMRVTLASGHNAPKLHSLTLIVPSGLDLRHRHGHTAGTTVTVLGAKVKSIVLRNGRIVVTLRRPAGRVTIVVHGLSETRVLMRRARRHHIKRVGVAIVVADAGGAKSLLSAELAALRG